MPAKENKEIQFTLDGRSVQAKPGETVLSVAKRQGINIPSLCHHESVTPYGACRLCLVEVFWGERSKVVTSCIYMPFKNDVIETNNERVRRARRLVIELLLARCPEVEIICDLARDYGIKECRFPAETGASIAERCILCGLCVRVCDEVVGRHAIGYANRGRDRIITTPFDDQTEECIGCGACIFICPTGALHYGDVDGERIMKELNTRMPLFKCRVCGQPFATEKQIARVRERLNIPDELAETCPRCRGSGFRDAMEKVLGLKMKSMAQE